MRQLMMIRAMSESRLKPLNKSIYKQQGVTMITMIIIVVFILFQVVIAMNVIPVYLTDSSVKSLMKELPDDPKARGSNAKELKNLLMKRMSMNSIYTIKPNYVQVKKSGGENIVTIEYEPRGKLIGNLEYIVSFKHEAKVPAR